MKGLDNNIMVLIGAIAGGVFFLMGACATFIFLRKRKTTRQRKNDDMKLKKVAQGNKTSVLIISYTINKFL